MDNVSTLMAFLKEGGLDVEVDKDTLLITTDGATPLGELPDGEGVDHNINLDYSWNNEYHRQTHASYRIHTCQYGILIVQAQDNRLVAIVPVYECGDPYIKNDMILISGHEEALVIRLDDLTKSIGMRTR